MHRGSVTIVDIRLFNAQANEVVSKLCATWIMYWIWAAFFLVVLLFPVGIVQNAKYDDDLHIQQCLREKVCIIWHNFTSKASHWCHTDYITILCIDFHFAFVFKFKCMKDVDINERTAATHSFPVQWKTIHSLHAQTSLFIRVIIIHHCSPFNFHLKQFIILNFSHPPFLCTCFNAMD